VPLMAFPRGATYALADLQQAGYDVVTMDTQTERAATRVALDNAAQVTNPERHVSEFPETVHSDGAHHVRSTVWLGLWVRGWEKRGREGEGEAT